MPFSLLGVAKVAHFQRARFIAGFFFFGALTKVQFDTLRIKSVRRLLLMLSLSGRLQLRPEPALQSPESSTLSRSKHSPSLAS